MQSTQALFRKLNSAESIWLYSKQNLQPNGFLTASTFSFTRVTLHWTAAVHMILIAVAFETTTHFPPYFIPLKSCLSKLMSKFSECWSLGNAESRGK